MFVELILAQFDTKLFYKISKFTFYNLQKTKQVQEISKRKSTLMIAIYSVVRDFRSLLYILYFKDLKYIISSLLVSRNQYSATLCVHVIHQFQMRFSSYSVRIIKLYNIVLCRTNVHVRFLFISLQ